MSDASASLLSSARDFRSSWLDRWTEATPRTRTRVQVAVFLGVVLIAYHYSLTTLLQSLNLDTPLAYIGLVPVIALALAATRSKPLTYEPDIHDRQLDYIIGLPLLVAALLINVILPRQLSAMFWIWRVDLLSLPLFVAGVGAIIFGVRATWRQRLAITYLFLAWPVPYSFLILQELRAFTTVTLDALHAMVNVIHVATRAPSSDGSLFTVVSHGRPFTLGVVSACSGVNGMVGFLLVGVAFGAIVKGPMARKGLWLIGGLLLLWVLNLARLMLIFWAGSTFGEHFAIQVLHPVVGLITFNIGVIIMLVLLRPMGLRLGLPSMARRAPSAVTDATADASWAPLPVPPKSNRPLAVPAVYSAIAVVVVLGMLLGVTNSKLRSYDLVASATGEPKLASYLQHPAAPAGWNAQLSDHYEWAKPYFGESSLWYRYVYTSSFGSSDLSSSVPVFADVINTSDLSSFSAYGVEACYRFHGYSLRNLAQVNLGGGITGRSLSYATKSHQSWSIVYWIWPVLEGSTTRYERVVLYLLDAGDGSVSAPGVSGITNMRGSLNRADSTQRGLIAARDFLVAFARETIKNQSKVVQGSHLVSSDPNVSLDMVNSIREKSRFKRTGTPTDPARSSG